MIDKETMKKELADKANKVLKKFNEPYVVEEVSIMNAALDTIFLGSLRVDEDLTNKVIKELKKEFDGYGKLIIRDRRVIPCCSLPYTQISFNISIPK